MTKSIEDRYRSVTKDEGPCYVACVSNRVYEKHRTGYKETDKPELSVDETQIVRLRHYLRHATGEGPFNEAVFLHERELPSIINSFEVWCSKTHLNRKREVEAIIFEPKEVR